MFNIGGGELILIGLVAILFIRPEQLPRFATTLGRWFAELQKSWRSVREGFEQEVKRGVLPPKEEKPKTDERNDAH